MMWFTISWTSMLITFGAILMPVLLLILRHALNIRKKNTVLTPAQVDVIISRVTKALPSDSSSKWHFKGTCEGLRVFEKRFSVFPWSPDQTLTASTVVMDTIPKHAFQACLSVSSFPSWFRCIEASHVTTASSSLQEEGAPLDGDSDDLSFTLATNNPLGKVLLSSCKVDMKRTWKTHGDELVLLLCPNSSVYLPYEWVLLVFSIIPNIKDKSLVSMIAAPSSSWFSIQSTHAVLCSQLCAFKELISMEQVNVKQNTDTDNKSMAQSTTRAEKKTKAPVKQSSSETQQQVRGTTRKAGPPPDNPYVSFGINCAHELVSISNASEQDGWTNLGVSKGIAVMKKIPTSGNLAVNCIKGTKVINAPPDFILRVLMDPQHSTVLDDMLKDVNVVKKVTDSIQLLHLMYKGVFPTSPRDFAVCNVVGRMDANTRVHAACSIVDELIPEVKGYVRGNVIAGGYCIKDVPGDPQSAEVIYITQVDLKGNVPAFVINKLVESQPQCINELNKIVIREFAKRNTDQLKRFEDTYPIYDVQPSGPSDHEDDVTVDFSSPLHTPPSTPTPPPTSTNGTTTGTATGTHLNPGIEIVTVAAEYEDDSTINTSGNFPREAFDEDSISIATVLEKIPPFKGSDDSQANRTSYSPSIGNGSLLEYPRNEGTVDFRTLSNQIAAKMLEEMFHVSTFDVMDPETYKDQGGGWKFQGIERDVGIFKKKAPNSSFNSFLGRGIIELGPQEVFNCVRNPNQRYTYDNMLKELHVVKQIEEGLYILHLLHETNQCFLKQSRDFCLLVCERVEPNKKMILGSSIDVAECPPQPGVTRGRVLTSGWIIEPYRCDKGLYTQLTYVLQVDIGGVPATLVNLLSRRQPLAVSYIREFLLSTSLTFKEENELKPPTANPSFSYMENSPVLPPRFRM